MDRRTFLGLSAVFAPTLAEDRDPAMHVINRLTFGPTPELLDHVRSIGVDAYIEEQLHPEQLDTAPVEQEAADLFPEASADPASLYEEVGTRRGPIIQALAGATTLRALKSPAQLYERMVQFWGDHVNVFVNKGPVVYFKPHDDVHVARAHALGNFRDLLGASAHSPAMLIYLDNAQSVAVAPNENYARELLELHTLGVDGGYTEDDIKETARALTGWSVDGLPARRDDAQGVFRFRPNLHDRGRKTVLGVTLEGDGEAEGEALLDLLARHPSTARHIATKLVRRFVADEPPAALVERAADEFAASGGDIRATLRVIFFSDELRSAPPKLRRPFEYTIAVMRAVLFEIGATGPFIRALIGLLSTMGHIPFNWPAPNGYPDHSAYWMNNLLPRWNAAMAALVSGRQGAPDYETLGARILFPDAGGFDGILNRIADLLYGRALDSAELDLLRDAAAEVEGGEDVQMFAVLALMLMAPPFQSV